MQKVPDLCSGMRVRSEREGRGLFSSAMFLLAESRGVGNGKHGTTKAAYESCRNNLDPQPARSECFVLSCSQPLLRDAQIPKDIFSQEI